MRERSLVLGTELVVVGTMSLIQAENRITACQNCSPAVSRPFKSVLTEVLGGGHPMTEFVIVDEAVCPNCDGTILENTLVRCEGEPGRQPAPSYSPAPLLDDTDVILIDEAMLDEASRWISGCQGCTKGAEMTFDYVLDTLTDSGDPNAEYVMCHPVQCPHCHGDVTEKTLIVVH